MYDHINAPTIFSDGPPSLLLHAISAHERAHQALSNTTISGSFIKHLVKLYKQNEVNDTHDIGAEVITSLMEAMALVHEGYATYVEWIEVKGNGGDESSFRQQLQGLDENYIDGFDLASQINHLVQPEHFPGMSSFQIDFLRKCALVDICRFCMNVPAKSANLDEYVHEVLSDSPNLRYTTVMSSIGTNSAVCSALHAAISPMLVYWSELEDLDVSEGNTHSGIKFKDNIESHIAAHFSSIPYQSVRNCPLIGAEGPDSSDTAEAYLLRAYNTEIELRPKSPPTSYGVCTGNEIIAFEANLAKLAEDGLGCYANVCIMGAEDTEAPSIGEWFKFSICASKFDYSLDGRRTWQYLGDGTSYLCPLNWLPQILRAFRHQDKLLTLTYPELGADTGLLLDELAKLASAKKPLMMMPRRLGSLRSITDIIRKYAESQNVRHWMLPNWEHYGKSGSSEIAISCILPESQSGVCYLNFITSDTLYAYKRWLKACGPFPNLLFEDLTTSDGAKSERIFIDFHGHSWTKENKMKYIFPQNFDALTAHILDIQW